MNRLSNWPWKSYNKFKYENIPNETRIAMESKDMVRWRPFIYGRPAVTWKSAHEKWPIRVSTKWKQPSRVWAASLVSGLFTLTRTIWDDRNAILH